MKGCLKFFLPVILLLGLVANVALALDVPSPEGFVLDQAGVLSPSQETQLESQIGQLEQSTTAEIGILLLPTMGGAVIDDYAVEVGQTWGVGKKDQDNGLMIVVAVNDRKWFVATGYGLEGALPDILVHRLGEKNFPPAFRQGDYAMGLQRFLNDVGQILRKEVEAEALLPQETNLGLSKEIEKADLIILFTAAGLLAVLFWLPAKKPVKFVQRFGLMAFIVPHFLFLGGAMFLALGFVAFIPVCLFYSLFPISMLMGKQVKTSGWIGGTGWRVGSGSSFSSGSSFGGFGGGSFGGGGGGGSW